MAPGPAGAQAFDVPEGFVTAFEPEPATGRDWRPLLTVRPADGSFAELSAIRLGEVAGAVDDADAWLEARLTADVGDREAAEDLLSSPDSPFGDPAFDALREVVPQLFEGLRTLSRVPLQFCEGPAAAYNAAGALRELYCVYQIGPFRQYLTLRLQEVGGRWFYTEIRAMNERRFRHLVAIANSFRPTP